MNTTLHPSIQQKDPVKARTTTMYRSQLSRTNHIIHKDEEIPGMSINIKAIETCTDIQECMTAEEIWLVTLDDGHLG